MGTCSYVLTGTDEGMKNTFGSTCHGAGRALSRAKSRRTRMYSRSSMPKRKPAQRVLRLFLVLKIE